MTKKNEENKEGEIFPRRVSVSTSIRSMQYNSGYNKPGRSS